MNWEDFDILQVGRCSGMLEFQGAALEIAFEIDWKGRSEILLKLAPLPTSGEVRSLAERLYRGDEGDRRIPRFSIVARTEDGRELTSRYGTLSSYKHLSRSSGSFVELVVNLGQVEIRCSTVSDPENTREAALSVEYFSKGQLGYGRPEAAHQLGKVWIQGKTKPSSDPEEYTGVIGIDGAARETDVSVEDWLEEADRLAARILQVLSLAHGCQFFWEIKRVFGDGRLLSVVVRPQMNPLNMRVAVFHHLDLQPALDLAVTAYTDELDERTGIGVALSWFLSVTHSSESQFLHIMIALEHLVHVFSQSSPSASVVPSSFFRNIVRSRLDQTLEDLLGHEIEDDKKFTRDHADELAQGIGNANRRSFRCRLEEMLKSYSVGFNDLRSQLRDLIKMRNAVTHRGLFRADELDPSSTEVERLRNVAEELLVRIFLTLLAYDGRYISPLYDLDWRPLPRRESETVEADG